MIKHTLTKDFVVVHDNTTYLEKGKLGNTLWRSDVLMVKDFDTEEEMENYITNNNLTELEEMEVSNDQ